MTRISTIIATLALILCSGTAGAVTIKVKPVVGADFQFRIDTEDEVTSYFYGAFAGARASMNIGRAFNVDAGLQYKYSFSNNPVAYYNLQKGDGFISEHSIELPATFGVKFKVFKNSIMHIDIGPTGTFGMASTLKTNKDVLYYESGKTYDTYALGFAQRWNFCLGGNFSLELGKFGLLGLGYRYAFLNSGSSSRTIYNHCANITLLINL